jgi:hypothetical protein
MGMFIGLGIAFVALIPTMIIGDFLDKKFSTEVGGLFRLLGGLSFAAFLVYLIGPENLDALEMMSK